MPIEEDAEFVRRLEKEAEAWVSDGHISQEQKEKILGRYGRLKEGGERAGHGKLITALSVLGAILVGLGVILFVASNWSRIPKIGKLSIIYLSLIASYASGFYLRHERGNYPRIGASLMLLGSFIFGAGIYLVAQIYHISVHFPNGPLMWAVGVLPLAYLLGLRSILSLALLDLLMWLGMEAPFHVSGSPFDTFPSLVTLYLLAGLSLWAAGAAHRGTPLKKLSGPYTVIGAFAAFLAGFIFTFRDFYFYAIPGDDSLLVFYIPLAAVLIISVMVRMFKPGEKDKGLSIEMICLSLVAALALYGALSGYHFYGKMPRGAALITFRPSFYFITTNVIFALGVALMITLGYLRRYTPFINIGLVFFVLDAAARYFDLFWKLLPKSVFFMVGGAALLAGGFFLEKKRRKVLMDLGIREDEA